MLAAGGLTSPRRPGRESACRRPTPRRPRTLVISNSASPGVGPARSVIRPAGIPSRALEIEHLLGHVFWIAGRRPATLRPLRAGDGTPQYRGGVRNTSSSVRRVKSVDQGTSFWDKATPVEGLGG